MSTLAPEIKRTNYLFVIFTLLLLFKGFFRKLNPSLGEIFYLSSDIVLISIILMSIYKNINLEKQRVYAYLSYIILIIAVLPAAITSFFYTYDMVLIMLGIREYLFPPLIFFAGLSFFSNVENLERYLRIIRIVGIFSAILGITVLVFNIQSPLLNPIEGHLGSHSSEFGEFGYIASVFDSPEKYTIFLLFVFCFTFPNYRRDGMKAVLFCLVILLGIAVSGRRVGTVLAVIALLTYFTLVDRNPRVYLLLAIVSPVGYYLFSTVAGTLSQVFLTTTYSDIYYYFGEWLIGDIKEIFNIGVNFISSNFGQGSPGASSYHENLEFWGVESLISRLLYYVGIFGFVGISLLLAAIIISLFFRWRKYPSPLMYSSFIFCGSTVLWNIKSGNILVWPELFYISLSIAYSLSKGNKNIQMVKFGT
jgi:hypothetical protein